MMRKYSDADVRLSSTTSGRRRKRNIPGGMKDTAISKVRVVSTTPYAVFVRTSPVYKTCATNESKLGITKRISRNGRKRLLPFRPDPYPYANERWSAYLLKDRDNKILKPE